MLLAGALLAALWVGFFLTSKVTTVVLGALSLFQSGYGVRTRRVIPEDG